MRTVIESEMRDEKACCTGVEIESSSQETEGGAKNQQLTPSNLKRARIRGNEPALVPGKRALATFAVGVVDLESHGGNGLSSSASGLARVGNAVQIWLAHNAGVVHVAKSGRRLTRGHVGGEVVPRLRGRGRRRRGWGWRLGVARGGGCARGGSARRAGARAGVGVLADQGLDLLKKIKLGNDVIEM